MTKIFSIIMGALVSVALAVADPSASTVADSRAQYEAAIAVIKKYETMHRPKDWPYIGYGHRVWPGDPYRRGVQLSEKQADMLLRADLDALCARYRSYGADSLLLATLAYNVGHGMVNRSGIVTKLRSGDRNIRDLYVSYNRYNGKPHKGIRNRRIEEFDSLFRN